MTAQTRIAIDALQEGTREKVEQFHYDVKAMLFDEFPGYDLTSLGSAREFSNEVGRGKSPNAPFMHFSRLAIDFVPVVNGRVVNIEELKRPEYDAYNRKVAGIAASHDLTPGVRFNHPEHFEDRRGMAWGRDIQDRAESGEFGFKPVRDKTRSQTMSGED